MPSTFPSFYGPVDESQRTALLEAYLESLHARDGELDPQTGTLSRREETLAAMNAAPVRFAGRLEQADFDRLYDRFDPRDSRLTPELLLLLTFCRMNAGEAYGVRIVKAVHGRQDRGKTDLRTRVIAFAQEEEEYHTRILVGAAGYFGIRADRPYRAALPLKVLIHTLAYAPRPLFHPILFASEAAGVYLFNWTLTQVPRFYQDQPQLQQALEQRLVEILIDEVGHVAFNRLVLGNAGRALGRFVAGLTVRGFPFMTPELSALGFDGAVQGAFGRFDYQDLPAEVKQRGFFA